MNKVFRPVPSDGIGSQPYDVVISALGYESRCVNIATLHASVLAESTFRIAYAFAADRYFSYETSREQFEAQGYEVASCSDGSISDHLKQTIESALASRRGSALRILVDISSFSRFRLAAIVEQIYRLAPVGSSALFAYTIAEYTPPSTKSTLITKLDPLSDFFAGRVQSPGLSLPCLIGLGYEADRAVGAIEFLELTDEVLFMPISPDRRYDEQVRAANKILLEQVDKGDVLTYEVNSPLRTFSLIQRTLTGMGFESRPITLPMGPKIFALTTLLVAANNWPEIPVWSVSSVADEPVDRKASNEVVVLSTTIEARVETEPGTGI